MAWLIRAHDDDLGEVPHWVRLLHAVLSGAVTADNMDYVRRDAYMCGVSLAAVDVPRLIYYSFCSPDGLTFHKRALNALRAFLNARFYMYENVYFHRIGHAIDLHMREIFSDTMDVVLPHSPLDDLRAYRHLTEWSLFTEVERWADDPGSPPRRRLPGRRVAAHHPPRREVPHGLRAGDRARLAAARGQRLDSRAVPRAHPSSACRPPCAASSSSATSPRKTRAR